MTSTVLSFPTDRQVTGNQTATAAPKTPAKPARNVPNDPKTWTLGKKIEFAIRWKIGTFILRLFGINCV